MSRWFYVTGLQEASLVVLRTVIGWHFLYEGYFKLMRPAWGRDGAPLEVWTAAGYLKGATGPLADMFHALGHASWVGSLDTAIAVGLVLVGLSLMLGLFTQLGCVGALLLLSMFYLSAMPLSGLPEPRTEGTYLIVNKNLIEAAAVTVVLLFRTGRFAGVDRWLGTAPVRSVDAQDISHGQQGDEARSLPAVGDVLAPRSGARRYSPLAKRSRRGFTGRFEVELR